MFRKRDKLPESKTAFDLIKETISYLRKAGLESATFTSRVTKLGTVVSARIFPSLGRYYKTDTNVERSYSGRNFECILVAELLNAMLNIKKPASSWRTMS